MQPDGSLRCSDFFSRRIFPAGKIILHSQQVGQKLLRREKKVISYVLVEAPDLTRYRQSAQSNWIELETSIFRPRIYVNIWCESRPGKISCANSQISKQLCNARAPLPLHFYMLEGQKRKMYSTQVHLFSLQRNMLLQYLCVRFCSTWSGRRGKMRVWYPRTERLSSRKLARRTIAAIRLTISITTN